MAKSKQNQKMCEGTAYNMGNCDYGRAIIRVILMIIAIACVVQGIKTQWESGSILSLWALVYYLIAAIAKSLMCRFKACCKA